MKLIKHFHTFCLFVLFNVKTKRNSLNQPIFTPLLKLSQFKPVCCQYYSWRNLSVKTFQAILKITDNFFAKRIKTFVPTGLNPLYLYLIKQMELTRSNPSLQSYLSWMLEVFKIYDILKSHSSGSLRQSLYRDFLDQSSTSHVVFWWTIRRENTRTDGMLHKDRDVGLYTGENSAESSNSVLLKWPVCAPSHVGRAMQERQSSPTTAQVKVFFFFPWWCNLSNNQSKTGWDTFPLFRLQTRSLLNMKAGSDKRAFHHRWLVGMRD